jgi:hypothetical protein
VKGSEVTFGEFVEVIEQDVPVAARAADVPRPAAPLARWGSREALRAAVQTNENEEASSMTEEQRRDLAAAHGLDPDTATEEQVIEASCRRSRRAGPGASAGRGPKGRTPEPRSSRRRSSSRSPSRR